MRVQEGQQFDIRGTVDEFRHSVNMYMYWKPGMEIYVSHVRRRQIPSFVFPEGFKRSRPSKPTNQHKCERVGGEDGDDEVEGGSSEKRFKRKMSPNEDAVKQQSEKRLSVSPDCEKLSSPEARLCERVDGEVDGDDEVEGEKRFKRKMSPNEDAVKQQTEKRLSVSPDCEKLYSPEPGCGGSSEPGSGGSSGGSIKVYRTPDNKQYPVAELDKSPKLISPDSGKQILSVSSGNVVKMDASNYLDSSLKVSAIGESCEGDRSQDSVQASVQETVLEATLRAGERVVGNGLAEELEVSHLTFPCCFLLFSRFMVITCVY